MKPLMKCITSGVFHLQGDGFNGLFIVGLVLFHIGMRLVGPGVLDPQVISYL